MHLPRAPQTLEQRGQLHVVEEREAEQVPDEATEARLSKPHDNVERMSCSSKVWWPACRSLESANLHDNVERMFCSIHLL